MAVTYNWSYKPGVANKYGLTVAASADDVAPSNVFYVALWGNDATGNGSRLKPFRTINKAATTSGGANIIVGNGTYREVIGGFSKFVYADGNVVLDFNLTGSASSILAGSTFYGVTITNYAYQIGLKGSGQYCQFIDCTITNCPDVNIRIQNVGQTPVLSRTLIKSCTRVEFSISIGTIINYTISDCLLVVFTEATPPLNILRDFIINRCNVQFTNRTIVDYCCLYQCNVKFSSSTVLPSVFYPETPATFTQVNNITDLRNAHVAAFSGASIYNFPNSIVANPKFNNASVNDYTIALDSPARNLSYFGTFVGAFSITRALAIKATGTLSAFDNSSAVNINISDNSLTLIDVDANASIVTKPIDNTAGREMQKLHTFGINADRNGEYVDSTADLANTTISAGTTLSVSTPYVVEIGAITYDGNVYNAGQRFTSKSSSAGTFTTSTSGVVREILESPARENVEARFSDGALTTVDNTATLEELAWYFVEGNTVTYNGNSYAVGTFVKALTGITSFTGTGLLRKVFSDTDAYFYFEINQKPTSNNVGNSRTGAIVRGNGDKDFDRTAANVFPINKKFIQLRYTIQVNNLTP